MAGLTLPEKVAQIYYTYGLFCSSHPFTAISFALSVVLLCCYPLLNVPLPGNIPTIVKLQLQDGLELDTLQHADITAKSTEYDRIQLEYIRNETQKLPYIWSKEQPFLYIQQIILKTGVSPWNSNLKMWDAFRAPLQEVFRLLETIRNHEDPETKSTLANHCFQVDNVRRSDLKPGVEPVMPEYSCLLLSPANLWHQNLQEFSMDSGIVGTVYNHQSLQKGKVSVAEMAFGMQLRDAGVKRYPLRARPRVLQYAVTIFYQNPDEGYIRSLQKKLREQYPLYQELGAGAGAGEAALVYYPGQCNYRELVPLTITFVGLFLYVYFSVRKIEFIKSKLGLAACAVLTIAGSLSMTMGICFYFGFSLSLQGKEIFPYLVIIVGLENVLVLTKSVTTTDSRLDVKIRLAQGLSKEGWSITKNLLTEITIFTVSFFTFVPFIQEFSIFMIVSLISDYFIQMVFFATILGVDVRRMECFQEQNSKLHLKEYFNSNSALNWRYNYAERDSILRMTKSKSHPRLNGLHGSPTDVVAKRNSSSKQSETRVPKRIRLVNLWARTRFFQRAFMVWMLVWISMIVYNSGVVEYFVSPPEKGEAPRGERKPPRQVVDLYSQRAETTMFLPVEAADDAPGNDTVLLKHSPHQRPWTRLSPYHWSSILSHYNESLSGRHVAVLPPQLLSHRVSAELAAGVRHPDERDPAPLRWQALAAALDPIDIITDFEMESKAAPHQWGKAASELPIYPTTPMEILLLAILCTISVAVIAYMMVVLYRCVCSRNYAEWRAGWSEGEEYRRSLANQPAVQLVMEAVPTVVSGHSHEVECLVTDGEKVVSSCLRGSIKVWDAQGGEQLTKIDRAAYFKLRRQLYPRTRSKKGSPARAQEALKPPDVTPKNDEPAPRLRRGLPSHLGALRFRAGARADAQLPALETTKYDFAKTYTELYCSEQRGEPALEAKENIDITNQMSPPLAPLSPSDNVFIFSSKDKTSLRNRKHKGSDSDTVASDSDDGWRGHVTTDSPVWCMDLSNNLIILGCADGRVEFWEATTGKLMCVYRPPEGGGGSSRGVTHVRAACGARRVAYATLGGRVALLRVDAYNAAAGVRLDWRFTTAHRRTHKRTGSAGSLRAAGGGRAGGGENAARMSFSYDAEHSDNEEVQCVRVAACRPHQQPVSEMICEGGRILTGSQDHTLKVFSSEDLSPLLTLHGHCGPVTAAFVDRATPTLAGSGSQDGLLAVWDLHTGACLYSMQAHDGAVTSLAYTASYVVSAGADERLCVWDRFQGHMLNSLHIGLSYMSRMLPLTHSLLLAGDRGGLTVYDLSSGDVIRRVLLGETDGCVFVRQILPLKDAIVCDYANQLRIVRFPLVTKQYDGKSE